MVSYVCETCNYETNKKSNINNHNKSIKHQEALVHGKGVYPCGFCGKTYTTSNSRWVHEQRIHKKPKIHTIKCELCDTTYLDDKAWLKHVQESVRHNNKLDKVQEFIEAKAYIASNDVIKMERDEKTKIRRANLMRRRGYGKMVGTFVSANADMPVVVKEPEPVVVPVVVPVVECEKDNTEQINKLTEFVKQKQEYFKTDEYKALPQTEKRKLKQRVIMANKQINSLSV